MSVTLLSTQPLANKFSQLFINPETPEYRNTYKKTFFVTYL